jgi:hypothetical protein
MDHESIVSGLDAEISRLQEARALLAQSGGVDGISSRRGPKKVAAKKPVKRVLSAEARAKIAAAQKKRWAKSKRIAKKAATAVMSPA